ncbi:DUF4942 domain-containing protein [Rhodoferax antarcticus]|uniref:DUF4942 domain-containing protein n=1 Tax=Rhodoferax antarcticus ANT.BR TaxID=1111071 RepID=A0A1Q8Y964_9BURK|nr:DUF4942 domain-containing protein [Rhodoferax antarcticus]OLP04524.1 hypothetical protein BLL52_4328 [Rhodoferax antarcticus ANT.BR]
MKFFNTEDFEFYPTPLALAQKMWAKFKERDFDRVLEPSAGSGNLIKTMPDRGYGHQKIDCCEMDVSFHPVLKALPGVDVVGLDFLTFGNAAAYGAIIMNPPFSNGVDHVLKAWEIAFDCEIVALLNSSSLKNPSSQKGRFLCDLIAKHGSVEFIQDAFLGDGVQRETQVEVALIYLKKSADLDQRFANELIDSLDSEDMDAKAKSMAQDYKEVHDVAIPATEVQNAVRMFDQAVSAMKASLIAEAKASYCEARIGQTMANRMSRQDETPKDTSAKWVANEMGDRYLKLKDRAWASILRSADFESKLSSKAQKRFESEFSTIRRLEFTTSNIFGFFQGILDSQNEIQLEMMCDVFDEITKYSEDNVSFYKGWKSNTRHKSCGYRLKSTRFILPGNSGYYGGSISYEATRRLKDFDTVFALLDGKSQPDYGLVQLFRDRADDLKAGERLDSSYFSVRWYPRATTVHFFPKNQAVMDRLNKLVGQHRKWLPPANEKVSDNFWLQYEKSERFDKQVKEAVSKTVRGRSYYDNPMSAIFRDGNDESTAKAHEVVDAVLTDVLEKNDISVDFSLTHESADVDNPQMLLLAA